LRNLSPQKELARRKERIQALQTHFQQAVQSQLNTAKIRLTGNIRALQTISPLNTLARGYAIVQHPSGEVVTSTGQVKSEQQIEVRVADGEFGATVTQVGKKK